jgi:hypothetical protein
MFPGEREVLRDEAGVESEPRQARVEPSRYVSSMFAASASLPGRKWP